MGGGPLVGPVGTKGGCGWGGKGGRGVGGGPLVGPGGTKGGCGWGGEGGRWVGGALPQPGLCGG